MEVVAAGSEEFTLGFELVGLKIFNFSRIEEFKSLMKEDIGVVVAEEKIIKSFEEADRKDLEDSLRPIFVSLSTIASGDDINKLIKKSIGIEL